MTFVPELRLKDNVKMRSVIDRLILTFVTSHVTAYNGIKPLFDDAGLTCYVKDFRRGSATRLYAGGIDLPPGAPSEPGRTFAVVIQDPEPERLAKALCALDAKIGLVAPPRLFLLELALDFYPSARLDLPARTEVREQLVGLLQRHHLLDDPAFIDDASDARQAYPSRDVSRREDISFVFASPGKLPRNYPDSQVAELAVQERLDHGRHAHSLFLDSTLYRGSRMNRLLVRTQHKISNRRDNSAGTLELLAENQKRARIEVEVAGYDRLQKLGLDYVGDLSSCNFRTIRKPLLRFWLPTAPEELDEQVLVRNQLKLRGIYGIERLQQLAEQREKEARQQIKRRVGVHRPRERRGTGTTRRRVAWAECQDRVGHALDGLDDAWRGFGAMLPWR